MLSEAPAPNQQQPVATRHPLSFAQRSFWLLEQMLPRNTYSTLVNAIQIVGPVHYELMVQAFHELVMQHAALRTTIVVHENIPQQQINPVAGGQLAIRQLATNDEQAVAAYIINEFETPFDLGAGPLFRASLLHIDVDRCIFVLAVHHIVCDGWSLEIINRELFNRYEAIRNGTSWAPVNNGTTLGQFALWQQSMAASGKWSLAAQGWMQKFAEDEEVAPAARPPVSFSVERKSVYLPEGIERGVTAVGQAASCTKLIVFIAALNLLLSSWSGKRKARLATLVSTRFNEELEWTVGLFLNTLVLATALTEDLTFLDVLKLSRKEFLDAYGGNQAPFELLLDSLVSQKNINAASLCRAMFLYHPKAKQSISIGQLTYGRIDLKEAENRPFLPTTFDLVFSVQEEEQGFLLSVTYKRALYSPSTINSLLESLTGILERMVAAVDAAAFNARDPAMDSASAEFKKSFNRT